MLYYELGRLENSDIELEYGHIMEGGWPSDLKLVEDLNIKKESLGILWERLENAYEICVPSNEKEEVKTIGELKKIIYEYMCVV